MEAPGKKYDAEKRRYDLVPFGALDEVVDVFTFGAAKYGADNWLLVDKWQRRYSAAALRHMSAYRQGEYADPETGKAHIAHAACCLLMLLGRHQREALAARLAGPPTTVPIEARGLP